LRRAAAIAVLALAAGCGGPKESVEPTAEDRMPATPAEVTRACASAAATYQGTVRCPAKMPAWRGAPEIEFGGRARADRCSWLTGVEMKGAASHLLLGGQCRPLELDVDGDRWPAELGSPRRNLALVGAARPRVVRDDLTVGGRRALLIAWTTYTLSGTVHAGHQALIWNAGGEGHVVSAHFDADVPAALRLRLLRATAESMRPVR
jgi:hypothetical protein